MPSWRGGDPPAYFAGRAPGSLKWPHPWPPEERPAHLENPKLAAALQATDAISSSVQFPTGKLDQKKLDAAEQGLAPVDFHKRPACLGRLTHGGGSQDHNAEGGHKLSGKARCIF